MKPGGKREQMRRSGHPEPVFTRHVRRRAPWRRPAPFAAIVLVTSFVGLLAYGLVSSGPDTTIDSRLSAGQAADAPDFELPVLVRGRPGRWSRASARHSTTEIWRPPSCVGCRWC